MIRTNQLQQYRFSSNKRSNGSNNIKFNKNTTRKYFKKTSLFDKVVYTLMGSNFAIYLALTSLPKICSLTNNKIFGKKLKPELLDKISKNFKTITAICSLIHFSVAASFLIKYKYDLKRTKPKVDQAYNNLINEPQKYQK